MKKEIKPIIDMQEESGKFRATTQDERWYIKPTMDKDNGLPVYKFYPSITWIVRYYYTNPQLQKWRDEVGAEEADAIKISRGQQGSKVHLATNLLEQGTELKISDKLMNYDKGIEEEISVDEWEAILSYKNWFEKFRAVNLATEMEVFNDEHGYAGTLDNIMAIGEVMPGVRQIWILDKKISKVISKNYVMQISALSHCDIDYKKIGITDEEWAARKLCTLQLGYKANQAGYKFTEHEDKFNLFLSTMETWKEENPNTKPRQIDLPIKIKLVAQEPEEKKVAKKIKKEA